MTDANGLGHLLDCIVAGDEADFSSRADRNIDARALRRILLGAGREDGDPPARAWADDIVVGAHSVRIRFARIIGQLDLRACGSLHAPLPALSLRDCVFDLGDVASNVADRPNVDVSDAHLGGLDLRGSELSYLRGVGVRINGSVDLSGLRPLDGRMPKLCWCKLSRSVIEGDLLVDYATLNAPEQSRGFGDIFEWDWALNCCAARISGAVMIRDRMSASGNVLYPVLNGGILLDTARIVGDVLIRGAVVDALDHDAAISLERVHIEGSVTFSGGLPGGRELTCMGGLHMYRADIGESFDLYRAKIDACTYGLAVYAVGARVKSDLTLGQRLVEGYPRGDVVVCGRIWLRNAQAGALSIINVSASGAPGELRAWHAKDEVYGPVAVDLRGVQVAGMLDLHANSLIGRIDLSDARCSTLRDSLSAYGKVRPLLDGLRYDRLENDDWPLAARIEQWLPQVADKLSDARSGGKPAYRPQPFTQLAEVSAAHGDEVGARNVLSAKALSDARQRWRNIQGPLGLHWIVYAAARSYGLFFGFGLSPVKALTTFVGSIVLGIALFGWMSYRNAIIVAQTPVASFVTTRPQEAPRFEASTGGGAGNIACGLGKFDLLVYATDVFIPLVDLHEEERCDIDAVAGTAARPAGWHTPQSAEISFYRVLKAIYAIWGWLITTLALLTFSGIVRHRGGRD